MVNNEKKRRRAKNIPNKLDIFFEESGRKRIWLAKRLGCSRENLYQIGFGHRCLAQKYWKAMIEHTDGIVTLKDIMADFIPEMEGLEIEYTADAKVCQISLK